jgi:hypothetical protein
MFNIYLLLALLQAVGGSNGEPQFSLGNVATIVVVILTGAAIVLRAEGKLKALSDTVEDHIEEDKQRFASLELHVTDDDRHIGKRLYDELIRRFTRADSDRERMETKLDTVLRQTK